MKKRLFEFEIQPEKSKEPPKPERILAAWGIGSSAIILAAAGNAMEIEMREYPSEFNEQLEGGFTSEDPDHGIWIWEGFPSPVWTDSFETGREFDFWDFSSGKWRLPTEEEWLAIREGRSPWESVFVEEELQAALEEERDNRGASPSKETSR